jgi:hypothetical protein
VSKHSVSWVKKLPDEELKEFLLHSALIHS